MYIGGLHVLSWALRANASIHIYTKQIHESNHIRRHRPDDLPAAAAAGAAHGPSPGVHGQGFELPAPPHVESAAGSIAAGLGPSLPSPQKTLAAPALEPGPSGALGALGLLPLISGTSQRASDLAPPTIGDAAEAAKRLFAFRTAPPPLQDEIFDTAAQGGTPPAPNHLAVERARKEEGKVRALLEFVVRSGRRLTLDIFIPNAALWQAFADDTFEGPGLKSIADYATVLNGFAEQLAIFLKADHHLFPALASNHFAPWSADAFSGITKNYAERAAAHAAARADDSGDDERGADGDGRALPIPPDKLDELLFAGLALPAEIQALTADLAKAQAALAATPEPRNTRSAIRKRTGTLAAATRSGVLRRGP